MPGSSVLLVEASTQLLQWLAPIYGEDRAQIEGQRARYLRALRQFEERAGPGEVTLFRAPGRVNLIGEHTDYNDGYVMPLALDKDIVLIARPRADGWVNLWNIEAERYPARSFTLSQNIPRGPLGDWGNYSQGAAQALFRRAQGGLVGMDALVVGAAPWGVPPGAGLSSSSALTVATACTLAALNRLDLSKLELARLCSEAEWYVGTRGGIMDQFISILAQRGHALLLDCRPRSGDAPNDVQYGMQQVPLPAGYVLMICNSGVRREKTRSQFNVRVAECRLGVALLKIRYPYITHLRDIEPEALGLTLPQVIDVLDSLLPDRVTTAELRQQGILDETLEPMIVDYGLAENQMFRIRPRCRHVITENTRVLASAEAMRAGDAAELGRLMNESHQSMAQDYEASCPEVDTLARICQASSGVAGARVTGAGWGGCIVVLVKSGSESTVQAALQRGYQAEVGLATDIFICRSAPGAGTVGLPIQV